MRVFGPQHMATINGLIGTSSVRLHTKPFSYPYTKDGYNKFVLFKPAAKSRRSMDDKSPLLCCIALDLALAHGDP